MTTRPGHHKRVFSRMTDGMGYSMLGETEKIQRNASVSRTCVRARTFLRRLNSLSLSLSVKSTGRLLLRSGRRSSVGQRPTQITRRRTHPEPLVVSSAFALISGGSSPRRATPRPASARSRPFFVRLCSAPLPAAFQRDRSILTCTHRAHTVHRLPATEEDGSADAVPRICASRMLAAVSFPSRFPDRTLIAERKRSRLRSQRKQGWGWVDHRGMR